MENLNNIVRIVEKKILVFLITSMVVLGLSQILSRFVIKKPISWSEALLTYMFIWCSYIGASLALDQNVHFKVEIFVEKLPLKIRTFVEIISNILIIVFLILIIYKGTYLVIFNRNQMMPAMPFSMSWPYLALPLSFCFTLIHILNNIFRLIRRQ